MFDKLKQLIVNKYAAGLLRTIIAFIAGFLVNKGFDPQVVGQLVDSLTKLSPGLLALCLTAAWSMFQKKNSKPKIK